MATEKEVVLHAGAGVPAVEIPDLKKKRRERKKAGAAWSGVHGAGGDFWGAMGGRGTGSVLGEGAGLAGVETAAIGAAEGGGFFARSARFLAGIAESLGLSKMVVAAAAFMMMAAGLLGYELLKGKGAHGAPDMSGIADSIRIRTGGDDRFGVNGKGEIRFDPPSAAKLAMGPAMGPAAGLPVKENKAVERPAPDINEKVVADAMKMMATGQLAYNLSGAKLSSGLGGEFGGHNIFSGNSYAPKFGAGVAGLKKFQAMKGKMGAMRPSAARGTASKMNGMGKATSNRAMGQLKMANGMSLVGKQSGSSEGAASAAQAAFDQTLTPTGGNLEKMGAPDGDSVNSPSGVGGAPDITSPTAAASPPGQAAPLGNFQSALSQIQALAAQAMADMREGTMLIAAGLALIAIGTALLGPTMGASAALIAIGVALLLMGTMLVMKAEQEAAMARQVGAALAAAMQNQQQGAAINDCTNEIIASNGQTSAADCATPSVNQNETTDTGQIERVKAEENASPVITQ